MAQRQFKSTDSDPWLYGFGDGSAGNGSINTSTDAPIDSACSGTSGTTSLTATNASFATGQLIMIHQTRGTGVGAWELNKIASYSAGTITLTHALTMTYTNSGASVAQVLVMTQYNDLTINNAQTLTAKAWNGTVGGIIAYFVKGTLSGATAGTINIAGLNGTTATKSPGQSLAGAIGIGFSGGATSSVTSGNSQAYQGEGTAGVGTASTAANGNGSGGSFINSSNNSTSGTGGSHATQGTQGSGGGTPGTAGSTVGTTSLVNMNFGGGGGGDENAGNATYIFGAAAGGGGICLIIANNIDLTNLTITGDGGIGGNGDYNLDGGSGAGGSILLKTKIATLGTSKATASGGVAGGAGGAGGAGRIHLDYKTSYTGTTTPTIDVTQDATLDYPASANFFMFFN